MTTPPNHNTADQSGADERIDFHLDAILKASGSSLKNYSMHKTLEDMRSSLRSAIKDQPALQPIDQQAPWDVVPDAWLKLYACVNHAIGQIGVAGQIDTQSECIDSLMNALHDIDGGIVSTRAMELFDKADMPIFHATELALRECATPTVTPQPFPAPAVQSNHPLYVEQKDSIAGTSEEYIRGHNDGFIEASDKYRAQTAPAVAGEAWLPIETAPEGELVVCMWLDKEDDEHPARYNFDYFEDGIWMNYFSEHEHYAIAGVAKGRSEDAPYTHWMPLPAAPSQGAKQ